MNIRNRGTLKQAAAASLRHAPNQKKIIAVYTGVSIAISAGIWLLDMAISRAISGTGGLGSLGTRSILQTIQSLLPVLQMIFLLGWDMGYLSAVMNFSRHKSADTRTLTGCFKILGPIFRLELLLSLIISGILIGCIYAATILFMFTPWAQPLVDVVNSYDPSTLTSEMMITEEMISSMMPAMAPVYLISFVLFAILCGPLIYSYRMANYCLLDDPRAGARASLRWSKALMRGRRLELFKLDLSLWWYYALETLLAAFSFAGLLLPMLGVQFPVSDAVSNCVFQILYYGLIFLLHVSLRNYVETTYVKAYDQLRIPVAPFQGIVLGNIFQM